MASVDQYSSPCACLDLIVSVNANGSGTRTRVPLLQVGQGHGGECCSLSVAVQRDRFIYRSLMCSRSPSSKGLRTLSIISHNSESRRKHQQLFLWSQVILLPCDSHNNYFQSHSARNTRICALLLVISTVEPIQIAPSTLSTTFLPPGAQGGGYCGSLWAHLEFR
jgi:hypothetical protein